jgi:transposase-like protein
MSRTTYTAEQKTQALAAYAEVGPAEAARRTGIPSPTIRKWAQRAGVTGDDPRTRLATLAAGVSWEKRKTELADLTGAAAHVVLAHMVAAAERGDGQTARGLAVAYGVTVDKAQLLAGGATSRIEMPDGADRGARLAAVHQLKEQAAKRAQAEEATA